MVRHYIQDDVAVTPRQLLDLRFQVSDCISANKKPPTSDLYTFGVPDHQIRVVCQEGQRSLIRDLCTKAALVSGLKEFHLIAAQRKNCNHQR